ncbi:alkaline phosphatase D family protein [Streptomyces sp. NBC_01089]|uniref:alkaline phosphatase D family protein n=1 Tax=Streptomyces sp. NBC_01089 TaxID=2903747 RepID=UPI00386CF91B|nr:alkaline phosphatase D family protein [Streptomyces sp. NBC_01089]
MSADDAARSALTGRRRFLAGSAAALGAAATAQLSLSGTASAASAASATGPAASTGSAAAPKLPDGLFRLGVGSGDPLPDAVVLWTRLAPDPLNGGGMPASAVAVEWQVADDAKFTKIVRSGTEQAVPALAHSVHADAKGLRPGRQYWYRFRCDGQISPVGRTHTAPSPLAAGGSLRIALASCQNWQHGYFTPYADMRAQDPDLVLFVGDYIYESAPAAGSVRLHTGKGEPYTLDEYRNRYAQYRTDPDLQAMQAYAPWVVTFDDHEVDNDFAGEVPQDPAKQSHDAFVARLTAAYQAYYEHMPVRATAVPHGPHIQMYRRFDYGRLIRLNVLDTRQFRTDQAATQAGAEDPSRTMLGAAQKDWLLKGLTRSPATWNVIASQIMMAETDLMPGKGKLWYYDAWDGYQVERNALMRQFQSVRNPLVLSGDRHLTMISDLKKDFADPKSAVVGAEFVGTSISSNGDQDETVFHQQWDPLKADNPHWKVIDAHRGYHLFDIGESSVDAQVRVVDTVLSKKAKASTLARLQVRSERPGVQVV